MKIVQLLTLALGMLACTHSHGSSAVTLSDSTTKNCLPQHTQPAVVSSKAHVADAAPELPFFKDVVDPKRLFW